MNHPPYLKGKKNMTQHDFLASFPHYTEIGRDITDDEVTVFFRNDQGHVGEARQNRRTTQTAYRCLYGETAEMVVYWYTVRPQEEKKREVQRLIREARHNLEKAMELLGKEADLYGTIYLAHMNLDGAS